MVTLLLLVAWPVGLSLSVCRLLPRESFVCHVFALPPTKFGLAMSQIATASRKIGGEFVYLIMARSLKAVRCGQGISGHRWIGSNQGQDCSTALSTVDQKITTNRVEVVGLPFSFCVLCRTRYIIFVK